MIENIAISLTLKNVLKQAELAWFRVYDSSYGRKRIVYQGDEYAQLPLRYGTKAKILAYFRKYWGIRLSSALLCSMQPIVHQGRVYVIVGDPEPTAFAVESARIVRSTGTCLRIRAILSGDPDGNLAIYYNLMKTSKGYRIIGRTRKDYRFYCPR